MRHTSVYWPHGSNTPTHPYLIYPPPPSMEIGVREELPDPLIIGPVQLCPHTMYHESGQTGFGPPQASEHLWTLAVWFAYQLFLGVVDLPGWWQQHNDNHILWCNTNTTVDECQYLQGLLYYWQTLWSSLTLCPFRHLQALCRSSYTHTHTHK